MTVYLVERVCEIEYGCTEVVKIFASRKDAEKYVNKHQSTWMAWWDGKERPYLSVSERRVFS